eukprot:TRINITY_DN4084_c0_g1_i2.p1 TRINITY_DN4084_c0_g1~~TRINITY_DN4084_c0_g1_i2.p1  ORF type:complete len:155 (-),score=71.06 TRINITY_DN4084_c0_g1_i2:145-609(-)
MRKEFWEQVADEPGLKATQKEDIVVQPPSHDEAHETSEETSSETTEEAKAGDENGEKTKIPEEEPKTAFQKAKTILTWTATIIAATYAYDRFQVRKQVSDQGELSRFRARVYAVTGKMDEEYQKDLEKAAEKEAAEKQKKEEEKARILEKRNAK